VGLRRQASPFISFTDLLSVLFLVLLISLMVALQTQGREAAAQEGAEAGAERTRRFLMGIPLDELPTRNDPSLPDYAGALEELDFDAQPVGPGHYRASFGKTLFPLAGITPNASARPALENLGTLLFESIRSPNGGRMAIEDPATACLEVAIQGHADSLPVISNQRFRNNMELSALRAITVERMMRDHLEMEEHELQTWNQAVSVSGYGARRPLPNLAPTHEDNRRLWVEVIWHWGLKECTEAPPLFEFTENTTQ
jgi:hypothetical protein